MSGDEGDLTGAEIQEFVAKVRNLPGFTDVNESEATKAAPLFLRARKRDVDRAVELYKANKRMRYTENVDFIDPLEDGVRRELLSGKFTVLPTSADATSKDGEACATVAIFTAHRHWPPLTTHRDTLKGVLYQLDIAMMDEHSQRKGLIVLYDMRDAKYGNFDYHLCIKLLNLFKGVYPARLRKVIIVEAPIWFRAPFGVLRLFVKEKIRDRISTVDIDDIHNHLPSSVIQTLFHQLTEHRHFDWLRTCLEKSGHASQAPKDYFVAQPPVYNSLSEFDVLQCPNRVPGLKAARYGSLRYSQSTRLRRNSDDPILPVGAADLNRSVYKHPTDATNTSFQAESLSRRDSGSLNRMLTSMYNSVHNSFRSSAVPTHDPWSFKFPTSRPLPSFNNNGIHTCTTTASSTPASPRLSTDQLNVTDPLSQTRLSVSEFLVRVNALGLLGLCAEFDGMFKDKPIQGTCDRFLQTENRRRNRYLDVPCLDSTAVELSDGTYIHANWVHGYKSPRAYILAQGPLDNTRRDFWMTIWEYRVPVIVMLTRIVEGQRVKCTPYWPSRHSITSYTSSGVTSGSFLQMRGAPFDLLSNSGSVAADTVTDPNSSSACYGEFHVLNVGETLEENGLYRRTRLEVRKRRKDTRRSSKRMSVSSRATSSTDISDTPFIVDHLLYLGWPDFDVPSDPDGFLKFLRIVNQLHQVRCQELAPVCNGTSEPAWSVGKLPLLIHCSAGIGRTGTFVTVDICLQQALSEGFIDVPDVVNRIRDQRAGAVQVSKQYAFVHTALASSLAAKDQTNS